MLNGLVIYSAGALAIDPLEEELEEADSTFMTTDFSGAAGCSQCSV